MAALIESAGLSAQQVTIDAKTQLRRSYRHLQTIQSQVDLEKINEVDKHVMPGYLGIKIVEVGPDYFRGTMPVEDKTKQPFGVLHGGASVVLAETLGSMAGYYCLSDKNEGCFGIAHPDHDIAYIAQFWRSLHDDSMSFGKCSIF